jgi:MFS family permease
VPIPRSRTLAPVLVFVGLIVSLVSSLGAPLIPTIARELHSSVTSTQWSLTATLLVGAVASPLVGRLGDGPHRKRMMLACLGSVTLGGVLAAVATTVGTLIAGRALQGMGLAVMPLTMATAREHLSEERAPHVIAKLSVVAAVGVGLGYPVTGLIAEHGGTAAAFWFGACVSGAAFVATLWLVPTPAAHAAEGGVDFVGGILAAVGLLALLLGCEEASSWGWGSDGTLGLFLAGTVVLTAWVRYELSIAHPLVELRLVRHPAVISANVAGLALGVGMYLSIVLITQFIQTPVDRGFGFGQSTFVSGLALLPLSAASFAASSAMPYVQRRFGSRPIVPVGALLLAAACLFFGLTGQHLWQAFAMFAIAGLGLGFTFAAMPQLIVGAVPPSETSSSMSLYQVTRFVGFAIGSSLSVTLLRTFGDDGIPTHAAYRDTFLVATAIIIVTAAMAWVLAKPAATVPGGGELAFEDGIVAAAGLEMLDDVSR